MMMNFKFDLSIIIPCYEMGGNGEKFLTTALFSIRNQLVDFTKIQIIVSDHSEDDNIMKCCNNFKDLNILYLKNSINRGSMSDNTNNCIRHSTGRYIKPLYQDDLFYSKHALRAIVENLNDGWYAHEYIHLDLDTNTFYNQRTPYYNNKTIQGINTIGPPSSIFFKNDNNYFDDNLLWNMDVELYYRLYNKYGEPTILQSYIPFCVVTTWPGQTTNTRISKDLVEKELKYIKEKHNL